MNKIFSIIISMVISLATIPAMAVPTLTSLKEGQKAPYAGVLFSVEAAAEIKVDIENARTQCKIESEKDLELERAQHVFALARLRAAEHAAKQQLDFTLSLKNDQISFLTNTVDTQNKKLAKRKNLGGLYLGLGVLSGVLLTVGAGYAIGQAAK